MKVWKYAAAFVGGALVTAAVAGGVIALDDSSDNGNNSAVSATETAGSDTVIPAAQTDGECMSAADIYEEVRPSVVQIGVSSSTDTPFGQQESSGTGSGIVLDDEGHILTNNHVAGAANTIDVRFSDGDVVTATLVSTDPANDLAVIKVDPADHDLSPATLGDSSELRPLMCAPVLRHPAGGAEEQGRTSGVGIGQPCGRGAFMPSGCSPRFARRRNLHDIGPRAGIHADELPSLRSVRKQTKPLSIAMNRLHARGEPQQALSRVHFVPGCLKRCQLTERQGDTSRITLWPVARSYMETGACKVCSVS